MARQWNNTRIGRSGAWMAVCLLLLATSATAQLRMVTYNCHKEPYGMGDTDWPVVLQAMGDEEVNGMSRPIDVLAVQEVDLGSPYQTQYMAQMLNNIYSTSSYSYVNCAYGDGYNTQGYVYNTDTVQLLGTAHTDIGTRHAHMGKFRPVGYSSSTADAYLFNVHFKAYGPPHNQTRKTEARNLRTFAESVTTGVSNPNLLYLGDFNFTEGPDPVGEPGYGVMLEAWDTSFYMYGPKSQSVDPLDGAEDLFTSTYSSGSPGGRLDYQFPGTMLVDGQGMDLVDESGSGGETSYHTFGIEEDPIYGYAIVPRELMGASDHLPVVADYKLPSKQSTSVSPSPGEVLVGSNASVSVSMENVAPVEDPSDPAYQAGADDLDYQITGSVVDGTVTGADLVGGGATVEQVSLKTDSAGIKSGTIDIASDHEGAYDPATGALLHTEQHNLSYTVLDHANGSFNDAADQNQIALDFGLLEVGDATGELTIDLWNLVATAGYTADLVIETPTADSGDTLVLTLLDGSGTVVAGSSLEQTAQMLTDTAGQFQAVWEIVAGDEDLPGATDETLTVTLTGEVWLPGDFDADLDVDGSDYGVWASHLGLTSGATRAMGDADYDGDVDTDDFGIWSGNNGMGGGAMASVPEPASVSLLFVSAGLLLRRRRGC
jgi:endonuclease/exonuclease/phosphatase family metal-dependent hydrolase